MEEAQEKDMDTVACFKSGKSLTITGEQYNVCSQNQMINLLASSNRYGYVFYATETDGLALIPSTYIDRESRFLSKTSQDDDEDDEDDVNENGEKNAIIYRSYIPGQLPNKNSSIIPYWLSLNADETILALVLLQSDIRAWLIILYDVVKLIQMPNSTPICPPIRLSSDDMGVSILYFTWNPAIPTIFAYLDGHGSVISFEIDQMSKQIKALGKSNPNDDNSSICWSPKGKQIVVVKYDGALELYDPNMALKKTYPSVTNNSSCPPCISVLWMSTNQFLLGFAENNPDENTNDNSFFHIMITYDKDQPPKSKIYNDLFFDAPETPSDMNPQYYYAQLNGSKIIFTGLSKSLKINVLGPNELNQDSLDIWTFEDQFRATVKGLKTVNNKRPILTGMALGLNSTLSISEGNTKLPSCPMLLLSNNEGVLQVYYFIHKKLSSSPCRAPEEIKKIQLSTPNIPQPVSSTNGFSFNNIGSTPTTTVQSKLTTNLPAFSLNQQQQQQQQPVSTTNTSTFSFNQQQQQPVLTTNTSNFSFNQSSLQTTNKPVIDDISKSISATGFNNPAPVQQTPTKTVSNNTQPSSSSSSNNKKLLQMITEFQLKLKSIQKPLSNFSESSANVDQSLGNLITTLKNITTSLDTSIKSIKSMTCEHIESMTKIENARHQIKLSQKENLYHRLKDRELDPWTQSRLDLIKTKYDQLKHNLSVLLQLTHITIHDKSLSTKHDDDDDDNEIENEDFLADLEISLNQSETMKQRIQNRIKELSHKVSETEKDIENICTKLNTDLLSSSTFTKTTMSSSSSCSSSSRPFHAFDADILSYLQATHRDVVQVRLPPTAVIHLSTTTNESKKQSTIEITKSITPSIQPSTPKQTNSPTVESEGFKNMLRIVRTSIDLFSGATSPEQLQELSNTIATSPLSSTQKSNVTSINKTPTILKTTSLPKTTTTTTKPLQTTNTSTNILQTPAKSVTSPIPTISVTPATPAGQAISSDPSLKLQPNKPIVQTATDLTKTQSTSGDSAIRSLLTNIAPSPTTITSIPNQSAVNTTPTQAAAKSPLFGSPPSTSTTQVTSQSSVMPATTTTVASPVISTQLPTQSAFGAPPSSAATVVTAVQSTSPTTKPIMSTGFGSKPAFGGTAFNLTPTTSSGLSFGGAATPTTTTGTLFGSTPTATAPISTAFGSAFGGGGATTTTATTTSVFGAPTTSIPSPFSSGFSAASTTTTPAPTTGIFGAASATTTSAPTTSIFGASATSPSSPFGSAFGSALSPATTSASSTGTFGGGFSNSTTGTSPFGGSFNTATSTPSSTPFGSSAFGSAPSLSSGPVFGGFGGAAASTAPTSTSNTSGFGSSGFGFNSASPAVSTAGTSTFGSSFSGFNTQSNTAGQSTGFSFGGFGSHQSESNTTPSGFGSFGSPSAATQSPSPFGGSLFGGAPAQSPSFGTTSSFGASSTQTSSSPSFTTYRK